ncbi:SAM hydrolase/SAM-dependent halogenase family protein [Levilinea saccharolytica]|uniref:Uncharacterized conserved protein n=1 Tax=Levilinea saccharolytica TaxID=229921 RepID=A0A0M8JSG2_9CHLR|nr:SAM-dependent chlorinase/fluorinase [Levilinea saccharolytica]KPL87431.1 hypothetical protein ADN01_04510 [Levilinea saccharolytica]GAP19735.1 uncharacterized conserved protein [Levilinea saccharolytica]
MSILTLLTDFGLQDGYVGIMKGVILRIAPQTTLVDITHEVRPQQILEGALTLERSVPYFPAGSVHVAVVDPGVGTSRRPIAAQLGDQTLVGPDNGLFTLLIQAAERGQRPVKIVHLNRPRFWLAEPSNVFHGRDIFAPVGAHLARGVPLEELGTPIQDPLRLELPLPQPIDGGWRAQIIHIDRFGNLAVNLRTRHLAGMSSVQVRVARHTIPRLSRAFGDGKPGELVALMDSSGYLSVCQVNGSAAEYLNAVVGDSLEVIVTRSSTAG